VIGFGLALLIIWIAPYTQAGFNPARDFGPRIIAYIKGWENSSFPQPWYALITVYILAPTLGAGLAAIATRKWND
jgi:glycerol uptake facilitator-like aquaporin